MTLRVLRTPGQVFHRMSPGLNLPNIFLMSRLEEDDFGGGRPQRKAPFSSRCIKSTYCQHDITLDGDLDHLAETVFSRFFSRFLPCKVTFSSLFYLWDEVTMCSPHLRCREFCSNILEGRVSTYIICNSSA